MNLLNFIIWLCAGAVIGWFASRMVELEHRRSRVPLPVKKLASLKKQVCPVKDYPV